MGYANQTMPRYPEAELPSAPLTSDAECILGSSEHLNKLLYELECQLFGPVPQDIEGSPKDNLGKPPLAHTLAHVRKRLETASMSLENILKRL